MSNKHFSSCSFCPKCGVQNVERDTYRQDNDKTHKFSGKPEFLRLACGFGFLLSASLRVEHGNALFKAHRAARFDPDYRPTKNKIS